MEAHDLCGSAAHSAVNSVVIIVAAPGVLKFKKDAERKRFAPFL